MLTRARGASRSRARFAGRCGAVTTAGASSAGSASGAKEVLRDAGLLAGGIFGGLGLRSITLNTLHGTLGGCVDRGLVGAGDANALGLAADVGST